MSAGTEIIKLALAFTGAYSLAQEPPAEAFLAGKKILNGMMASWNTRNIQVPHEVLDLPGDELGEPLGTSNGIAYALALELAPFFDNGNATNISPTLVSNAAREYNWIKQQFRVIEIPNKTISSTTARGSGNRRRGRGRTFFHSGETL